MFNFLSDLWFYLSQPHLAKIGDDAVLSCNVVKKEPASDKLAAAGLELVDIYDESVDTTLYFKPITTKTRKYLCAYYNVKYYHKRLLNRYILEVLNENAVI